MLIAAAVSGLVSVLAAFAVDQWLTHRVPIIGSFAGLVYSENRGIAFGVSLGRFQTILISVAFVLLAIVAMRTARRRVEQVSFGLVIGGGFANVLDRLMDGMVTDMIQVGAFPIFNVADVCINIGIGLLLLDAILGGRKSRKHVIRA